MRSEKGSITLYVLVAMLTLTAVLMTIYVKNSNAQMVQLETIEKIKAIYEDYDIEEVYKTKTGNEPQILGYERGAKRIIIQTLKENGISVDQNGKELIYYAATLTAEAPETIGSNETFGIWQKSRTIDLTGHENDDIYLWIRNEDDLVSKPMSKAVDASSIRLAAGDYAGNTHKIYVDSEGSKAYIPAGFTVSNVDGENDETTISKGLVIYSGNQSDVTDMTNIQGTVNQYVWIPVENPKEIYGTDAQGNLLGKLYSFNSSTGEINSYNWSEDENRVMKWDSDTSYREPAYLTDNTYADESTYNQDVNGNKIITEDGLKAEFKNMIESVEQYHGFYIGRYELTGTNGNPTVRKDANPLADYNWYTFYTNCEQIEDNNEIAKHKVRTSMIWGCQWDQAIKKSLSSQPFFLSNPDAYGWNNGNSDYRIHNSGTKESAYNIYDMGRKCMELDT